MSNVIARLTVIRDGEQPVEHLLSEEHLRGGFTIGADSTNTLRLTANTVSRQHAELSLRMQQIQLTRLSATNPVLVGDRKLAKNERVTLTARTEIIIVPFRLLFDLVDFPQLAPAVDPVPAFPPLSGVPLAVPLAASAERAAEWPIPADQAGRYLLDLPAIFRSTSPLGTSGRDDSGDDPDQGQFLGSYLKVFEAIWEPMEQRQTHLEHYFDPRTCPEALLPLLAIWLGVEVFPGMTIAERRGLIATTGATTLLRGTRKGLHMVIKASTRLEAVISDVPGQPYVFHVALPPMDATLRALVEQIIQTHKPAYMGYTLE